MLLRPDDSVIIVSTSMGIWNDTEGFKSGGTAETDIDRPEPATLEEESLNVSASDKIKCFRTKRKDV